MNKKSLRVIYNKTIMSIASEPMITSSASKINAESFPESPLISRILNILNQFNDMRNDHRRLISTEIRMISRKNHYNDFWSRYKSEIKFGLDELENK